MYSSRDSASVAAGAWLDARLMCDTFMYQSR